MQWLDLTRMVLFTLLTISSVLKWIGLKSFRRTLAGLGLPNPLIHLAVWTIPSFELLIAIGYLNNTTLLGSVIAFILMSVGFLWATYKGQKLGLRCNCFGNMSNERFGIVSYVRIAILIVLNVLLLFNSASIDASLAAASSHELIAVAFLSAAFLLILNLLNVQLEYRKRKLSEM